MEREFYLKVFKSFEEAEIYALTMDAALSPTEKFFQGRQLVFDAYRALGRPIPDKIEFIVRVGRLGESYNE